MAEEFRRGVARRWGLPSSVSEHGRRQWVAGALVEALPGWRSSEGELALATATAEVRAELGCRCPEEDGAEIGKRGAGWLGRALAVMKARPGASWPARTDRRRRAAVSRATRRAMSETGRPLCRSIQFVSRAMQCLTTYFRGA